MAPIEQIRHVADSHERLIAWLGTFDPVDSATPSELPGWTVGHVMTHIARNADSFDGMLTAAASGTVRKQYPGGPDQRNADIEAGSRRPWVELVTDVHDACDRLDATLASSDDAVWSFGANQAGLIEEPLTAIPHRRFREVEIHRLDLGLGATWRDWPSEFIDAEWPLSIARLPDRLPDGSALDLAVASAANGTDDVEHVRIGPGTEPMHLAGSRTELLAWITGRRPVGGAPELTPWP